MSKAEKFIQEHTKQCSNLAHLEDLNSNVWEENTPWLTPDQARKAVEIAREEIYEWFRINLCNYFDAPRSMFEMCLDDLKQTMER